MSAVAALQATPALREVRLYGDLGRRFGRLFRLAVKSPAEAVQALCAVLPGFQRAFVGTDGQRRYHVLVGRGAQRHDIGEDQVAEVVGRTEPIRFVPEIAGAKRQGLGQVIVGYVVYIAGLVLTAYGYGAVGVPMMQAGASMMIGGVVQMLSPQRVGKSQSQDRLPSYAFDGPVNSVEQGGPVPLAYGRVISGSTVVSQGISSTEVLIPTSLPGSDPTLPPYEPDVGSGGD